MGTTSTTEWCSTKHSACELLSFGDLLKPGEYRLLSRFAPAINFLNCDNLVSLVDASVGAGPVNIVLNDLQQVNSDSITVAADYIQMGTSRLQFSAALRYDSTIELPDTVDRRSLRRGVALFTESLRQQAPIRSLVFLLNEASHVSFASGFEQSLARRFHTGFDQIAAGKYSQSIRSIKGLGFGLTPAGDDFIAGLLIAFHIRKKLGEAAASDTIEEIISAAESENPFTMSLLRCAYHGRVTDKVKQAIAAIAGCDDQRIPVCAQNLLAIGSTSGADLGTGLIFGLNGI